MNDKDFDKIFGDKLREERAFNSQDSDWEQLSSRLDAVQQVKKEDNRGLSAAWLWLLLLPIMAFILWQMNDLKNQNKQLMAQLADVQSQLAAQYSAHDTVIQKVQKTDTLIIYKYLPSPKRGAKKSTSSSFSSKNAPQSVSRPTSVSNDFLTKNSHISDNLGFLTSPINTVQQDTTSPKVLNDERKMAELTEKLAALDRQITDLKQAITEQKISAAHLADCATKQDSLKKQLNIALALSDSLKTHPLSIEAKKEDKLLKNNRLFVGIQGGRINYKTTWKAASGAEVYKNFASYQVGLKLEYVVTDKLRLTAGGDYCPFSFLIYWQDARYNLPALQFDPQKEKYQKAETQQTLLQGNIGAKYLFTEGGAKWRPFVAAAYSMMHINPFETKFTYQPLWGTTNREQIVQSESVNIPNLLLLSGGFEYRFSKYGVAQAEAFYYKDVNKIHQTFDLFGVRAAVLLNIK